MKITRILAISSFAALLAACAADDDSNIGGVVANGDPIAFRVSEASRAEYQGIESLQKYGFYVYANSKTVGTSSFAPFMEKVKISYTPAEDATTAGEWGYSPVAYWPTEKNKVVDFYPVYAYDDPNVTLTYPWDKKPHVRYTVNDDVMKQTDFLWAAPILDVAAQTKIGDTDMTYGQAGLNFTFQHALSGIVVSVKKDDITYVDGTNTYTSMKEALEAVNPFVGAVYKKDYIHSIELSGAFPKFADVDPDATSLDKAWDFTQCNTTAPKYTLLASTSVGEESTEYAIYKNSEGDYLSTKKGKLVVLPCGVMSVVLTINHIVECTNGDTYLITATAHRALEFKPGESVTYDFKYNVAKFIRTSMKKLDTVPTIGIALGETADGMHAK